MVQYEEVILKLQKGDKIKSKKGILLTSELSNNSYNEYELEYLGDGRWRSVGKRETLESIKKLSKN